MNPFDLLKTNFVLFYLGPETIMPLASILATIVGVLLIGWRFFIGIFKKIFKRGGSSSEEEMVEEAAPEGVQVSQPEDPRE
jgi:hypothetical protein